MTKEKSLTFLRVKHAPPHFVSLTYVGTIEKNSEGDFELSDFYRVVEVAQPYSVPGGTSGLSINFSIFEEPLFPHMTVPKDEVHGWGLIKESENPEFFKTLIDYETQKRAKQAGIVMPGKRGLEGMPRA